MSEYAEMTEERLCELLMVLDRDRHWPVIQLPPSVWFIVASQLQLALRHPVNDGSAAGISRAVAETIVSALRGLSPEAADFLARGFDARQDVARS